MKFVGTIKGKPYLIDPETYEAGIRLAVIEELKTLRLPINPLIYNQAIGEAIKVIEKGINK